MACNRKLEVVHAKSSAARPAPPGLGEYKGLICIRSPPTEKKTTNEVLLFNIIGISMDSLFENYSASLVRNMHALPSLLIACEKCLIVRPNNDIFPS